MTANGLLATLSRFSYVVIAIALGSCGNAFRFFPNRGSDDYLLDQAQKCLDDYDFECAVEAIDPVLESQPRNETVVITAITAYAGRGDLRILDLITELSDGLASKNLFEILAEHFPAADSVQRLDVERAVEILEAYNDTASDRSDSLNILAFFLYYAEIGVIMSDYAYDGGATVVPAWDACSNTATNFPDDQVQLTGRALANLVDISSNLPGNSAISDAFSSFSGAISALGLTTTLACPADAATCKTVRMLVGNESGGIGLGPDNTLVCP
jgi:hypothetical protein